MRVLLFCLLLLVCVRPVGAGGFLRLIFDGGFQFVTGTQASSMRNDPRFAQQLASRTEFYSSVVLTADHTGAEASTSWFQGFLEVPETGEYSFYLRSDDFSELFLSSDHTPANAMSIAQVHGNTAEWLENGVNNSPPILLERGTKYYYAVFHIEGIAGDQVGVGWKLPNGTLERPMPARFVQPYPIDRTFKTNIVTAPLIPDGLYHQGTLNGHPQNQTVPLGSNALFTVTYEATQPAQLQWRRNGVPIPGATLGSYLLEEITVADQGAEFDVVITNLLGTTTSRKATVNPGLGHSAATFGNLEGVDLIFSRDVDPVSAGKPESYLLSNETARVAISGIIVLDKRRVRLSAPTPEGHLYRIVPAGVKDFAGAPMDLTPVPFVQAEGFVTRKYFTGISPANVAAMTNSFDYQQDTPRKQVYAPFFEMPFVGTDSDEFDTNCGGRVQAWFVPLETGNHVFWISADDTAELWLSTDASPANARLIVSDPVFGPDRVYKANSATAGLISLTAGRKYYMDLRHAEGVGGGQAQVYVQGPLGQPPASGAPSLSGPRITAFGKRIGKVELLQQPMSQEVLRNTPVELSIALDGALPWKVQWFLDDKAIPGGTNLLYAIDSAQSADAGVYYAEVGNVFSQVRSDLAVLKVQRDATIGPVLSIRFQPPDYVLEWAAEAVGFTLEATTNLEAPDWQPYPDSNSGNSYTVEGVERMLFFRLAR